MRRLARLSLSRATSAASSTTTPLPSLVARRVSSARVVSRDEGGDDDRVPAPSSARPPRANATSSASSSPSTTRASENAFAFATAESTKTTLRDALRECVEDARRGLGPGRRVTWAQLYVSGTTYDEEAIAEAGKVTREMFGSSPKLVGAMVRASAGGGGATREGVTLTAASMPGTRATTFRATSSSLPSLDDGCWREIAMSGGEGSTVGVTVLADAAFEDVDKLLERLHVAAPNSVAVGGVVDGGAVMFLNDDVVRHGAVGTLVSGDFDIDTHVAHGARPVGPVMSLTHARDNAVLELDDAPAHPLLLETLESLPETSKALPVMLGLGVNGPKGPFVCRDILSVGETGGVEVASAALREGAAVQLHVRDNSWALEQARGVIEKCVDSATKMRDLRAKNSVGATIFACADANRTHANDFRESLPSTPLGGAYVRSEIAPLVKGGASSVLSHTSAIAIYRERD